MFLVVRSQAEVGQQLAPEAVELGYGEEPSTLEFLNDRDAQSRVALSEQEIERGDVLDEAEVRGLLRRRSGEAG